MRIDWYLGIGETVRRVHLVAYRQAFEAGKSHKTLCNLVVNPKRIGIDPERPMIEQVTCAACRRIGEQSINTSKSRPRVVASKF